MAFKILRLRFAALRMTKAILRLSGSHIVVPTPAPKILRRRFRSAQDDTPSAHRQTPLRECDMGTLYAIGLQ